MNDWQYLKENSKTYLQYYVCFICLKLCFTSCYLNGIISLIRVLPFYSSETLHCSFSLSFNTYLFLFMAYVINHQTFVKWPFIKCTLINYIKYIVPKLNLIQIVMFCSKFHDAISVLKFFCHSYQSYHFSNKQKLSLIPILLLLLK